MAASTKNIRKLEGKKNHAKQWKKRGVSYIRCEYNTRMKEFNISMIPRNELPGTTKVMIYLKIINEV
ncbi:hypothetical protein ACJMK2_042168 [Sinanodonta woodiana]|uniref:Uncharacterized protein n=1 Tax=Sinanodonta woodiana TaxID=1069815 RepID=A0ABD3W6I5_SINWO